MLSSGGLVYGVVTITSGFGAIFADNVRIQHGSLDDDLHNYSLYLNERKLINNTDRSP
jgi:hypothetical protein